MKKCSICGKYFTEFGNNAQPVNDGTCCDDCNNSVVIPIRIGNLMNSNDKEENKNNYNK